MKCRNKESERILWHWFRKNSGRIDALNGPLNWGYSFELLVSIIHASKVYGTNSNIYLAQLFLRKSREKTLERQCSYPRNISKTAQLWQKFPCEKYPFRSICDDSPSLYRVEGNKYKQIFNKVKFSKIVIIFLKIGQANKGAITFQ